MKIYLEEYVGNDIRVTFVDNQEVIGFAHTFESAENTESGHDEISLETEKYPSMVLDESEIKSIELLID